MSKPFVLSKEKKEAQENQEKTIRRERTKKRPPKVCETREKKWAAPAQVALGFGESVELLQRGAEVVGHLEKKTVGIGNKKRKGEKCGGGGWWSTRIFGAEWRV